MRASPFGLGLAACGEAHAMRRDPAQKKRIEQELAKLRKQAGGPARPVCQGRTRTGRSRCMLR